MANTTTGLGPRDFTSSLGNGTNGISGIADSTSLAYDSTEERGTSHRDKAVQQASDGEWVRVPTDGRVDGQIALVESDQSCTVVTKGFVLFPYSGSEPAIGDMFIGGAAAGQVKIAGATPAGDGTGRHRVAGNPTTNPDTVPAGYVLVELGR